MTELSTPTIHLNGTSQSDLLRHLELAAMAIEAAERALRETCPNGRDYYPQGEGAIVEATRQFRSRMERLEAVRAELEQIGEVVAFGGHVNEAAR